MGDELTAARDTIRRLNRRCQDYEAALAEKLNANAGRSFGRALANGAATMYRAQLEEIRAALATAEVASGSAEHVLLYVSLPTAEYERLRALSTEETANG